jgi:hypothetical protein
MKTAALIRTLEVNNDAIRLQKELEPYFGESIFFMIDRYRDETIPAVKLNGRSVCVGRAFLTDNNLPWFDRVGWQCGDFMYYAALDALPGYDGYWLIESDLSFQLDTKIFFDRLDSLDYDFLATGFEGRWPGWTWHESVKEYCQGHVYGCFYPLTRILKPAAKFMLKKRSEYTNFFRAKCVKNGPGMTLAYANDEAFSASILKMAGFWCESLTNLAPDEFRENFSFDWPIHPMELPFIKGSVLHPVCNEGRSRQKFAVLADQMEQNRDKLYQRFRQFSERVGSEKWERFSGIPSDFLLGLSSQVTENTQKFYIQSLLKKLVVYFSGDLGGIKLDRGWVYQEKTAVLDFKLNGLNISFDICFVVDSWDNKDPKIELHAELFSRDADGWSGIAGLGLHANGRGRYLAYSAIIQNGYDDNAVESLQKEMLMVVADIDRANRANSIVDEARR